MKEGEQYVIHAQRHGLITPAQGAVLRRHVRHHSRAHMYIMLRLIINVHNSIPTAHTEAMRLVGK